MRKNSYSVSAAEKGERWWYNALHFVVWANSRADALRISTKFVLSDPIFWNKVDLNSIQINQKLKVKSKQIDDTVLQEILFSLPEEFQVTIDMHMQEGLQIDISSVEYKTGKTNILEFFFKEKEIFSPFYRTGIEMFHYPIDNFNQNPYFCSVFRSDLKMSVVEKAFLAIKK